MKILLLEKNDEHFRSLKQCLILNNIAFSRTMNIEAFLETSANTYGAFVIDESLLKEGNYEFVTKLRQYNLRSPILLFGPGIEGTVEKYLDAGADDYLRTPFVYSEFIARLKAVLRRYDPEFRSGQIGNTILDKKNHRLVTDKLYTHITGKELRIMDYLIQEHLNFVSTERLFFLFWDPYKKTKKAVVWVFISNLNEKLELIHSDYYIYNEKGFGYQLTPR